MAIANTLFSSEDVASQAPAPSSEAATGGTLGDGEGLEDAEGADMVDLTSLEGEVPQVGLRYTHTEQEHIADVVLPRHVCSRARAVWARLT